MSVLIGAARTDEDGDVRGRLPGDQRQNEVMIHDWYFDEWTAVLRPKTKKLANSLVKLMTKACQNSHIGYSQVNRLTLYHEAVKVDFELDRIETDCDCDCSSLVAVCCIGSGLDIVPTIYTGNMIDVIMETGKFTKLLKTEYTNTSGYLEPGDILVSPFNHTAIVLTPGERLTAPKNEPVGIAYASERDDKIAGVYRATTNVYIRCGAGKQFKALSVLKQGEVCRNYGYLSTLEDGAVWLYVQRQNIVGFINAKYLHKEE
jgi:hypothetical protein